MSHFLLQFQCWARIFYRDSLLDSFCIKELLLSRIITRLMLYETVVEFIGYSIGLFIKFTNNLNFIPIFLYTYPCTCILIHATIFSTLCFSAREQRLGTFRSAWPPFYTPPPPRTTASLRRGSSNLFHLPPTSEQTENGNAKQRISILWSTLVPQSLILWLRN